MNFDELFPSTIPINSQAAVLSGPRVLAYDPTNPPGLAQLFMTNQFVAGGLGGSTAGITAGTTQTQAGATALTTYLNLVSTNATAGNGVLLPPSFAGAEAVVINGTANALQVYGTGSDTVNGATATVGVSQPANSVYTYRAAAAGAWFSSAGGNYAGALPLSSTANGLTAHSGGGQGSALPLTASINRVTTVAAANDSVLLPASIPGSQIMVVNAAAANSMNVFPQTGDAINALAANTAFAMAANKTANFICAVAGTWNSNLTA